MFIYLLIYIPLLLFAYLDFNPKIEFKTKRKVLIAFVVVFTLFWGLRWEIGTDWEQFLNVYEKSSWENIFSFKRTQTGESVMDYGYMFINAVFHEAGMPYTVFLLATGLVIQLCYFDLSTRFTNYPILTYILLLNVGVPFPVRQSLSLAIALWAIRFVFEKKYLKFVLVALAATLIHKGSAIIFPVAFLPWVCKRYHFQWYHFALAYLSTFVISALLEEYIRAFILWSTSGFETAQYYAEHYLGRQGMGAAALTRMKAGWTGTALFNGLSYTFFFALLLYIREKFRGKCHYYVQMFNVMFLLYAFVAIMDNVVRMVDSSGLTEILGRVTMTVDTFPFVFPLIFVIYLRKFTLSKYIPYFIFIIYMGYKFWQQIPGSFYSFMFIPYKTVFD